MNWTQEHYSAPWISDAGYSIHCGNIAIPTAPQYRLTCYVLLAPDGEAVCSRDLPDECKAIAAAQYAGLSL